MIRTSDWIETVEEDDEGHVLIDRCYFKKCITTEGVPILGRIRSCQEKGIE